MRLRPAAAALTLVVALGVTACSGSPDAAPTPSGSASSEPSTSPTASATTTAEAVTVAGAPAGLATLVRTVYAGRSGVTAKADLGTWKGSKVAVVTAGRDVTLAVSAKGDTWTKVGGWWPSLGRPDAEVGGKAYLLALGSDAREKEGQKIDRSRADAIQIIGRDGDGGAGIVGLPRDSWVPLATGGTGKVNSAMVYGGPSGMTRTVRNLTGLPIERYLLMGFDDVRDTVNGLGGLPIVSDMSLPAHGIAKGPVVLTGNETLWYARERKSLPDGDFGRSRHQGQLLVAAAVQGRLKGIAWAPKVISLLDAHSMSNLSAAEVLQWVGSFYALDPTKVGRTVAPGTAAMIGGQSAVRLGAGATAAFRDLRDGNLSG